MWSPEPFDELRFADDYVAIGVPARRRDGIGVPLVAIRQRWWRDPERQSPPEKFFPPSRADERYQWVQAWLAALDEEEMRELVTDAWRMCVPKKVRAEYDLRQGPAPLE